jgi:RimJ/RimL family protein N-acetyltransferase
MNARHHTAAVSATVPNRVNDDVVIRRTLRDRDLAAIAELHRRVYVPEYGMNEQFVGGVAEGLREARARGWPQHGGGVWLLERDGELHGSLALTDEGAGRGRVRWFVLDPLLRGRGFGATLVGELLAAARRDRLRKLELETFSALSVAARIYRDAGFRLIWERERSDWGAPVVYQGYELELR